MKQWKAQSAMENGTRTDSGYQLRYWAESWTLLSVCLGNSRRVSKVETGLWNPGDDGDQLKDPLHEPCRKNSSKLLKRVTVLSL